VLNEPDCIKKLYIRVYLFISWKVVFDKLFFKFFYIYLSLEKLINKNFSFSDQLKILFWFPEKYFTFILDGKYFLEIMKDLKILYYLLIISNLVLKLLITIYILFWIFIFQFYSLKFNFYINFNSYFYNCHLLFSYHLLIKIFYLSNLIFILLIIIYFNFFIF
jgi:hypothetical protein